jgi:hypothetical protein
VSHAIQSVGRRCKKDYQEIVRRVKKATHVTCDETGWRIGGIGHWLHAAVTPERCAYLIDKARGSDATARLSSPKSDQTRWSTIAHGRDARATVGGTRVPLLVPLTPP